MSVRSVRPTTRAGLAVGAVVAVAGLAACNPSPDEFRRADPAGYEACSQYAGSRGAGGDYRRARVDAAAEYGSRSINAEIRAAVDDGTGCRKGAPVITDLNAFESACKSAGFKFR